MHQHVTVNYIPRQRPFQESRRFTALTPTTFGATGSQSFLDDEDIEMRVYTRIVRLCANGGVCYVRNRTWATEMGVHPRSVSRAITRLKRRGLIVSRGFRADRTLYPADDVRVRVSLFTDSVQTVKPEKRSRKRDSAATTSPSPTVSNDPYPSATHSIAPNQRSVNTATVSHRDVTAATPPNVAHGDARSSVNQSGITTPSNGIPTMSTPLLQMGRTTYDKRSAPKPNDADVSRSAKLRAFVRAQRWVEFPSTKHWADAFRILRGRRNLAEGEIDETLDWYIANYHKYEARLPVIKNGSEFGNPTVWSWVRNVMTKTAEISTPPLASKLVDTFKRIKNLGWTVPDAVLSGVVQRSYDAIRAFYNRLNELAATAETETDRSRRQLARCAAHIRAKTMVGCSVEYTENWMREMHAATFNFTNAATAARWMTWGLGNERAVGRIRAVVWDYDPANYDPTLVDRTLAAVGVTHGDENRSL